MPLTASNTEADTSATTRLVTFGAVPAASTVVFMTSIHSSTGSGVAADTGKGLTRSATISTSIALRAVAPAPCLQRETKKAGLDPVDLPILRMTPNRTIVGIRVLDIRSSLDSR